MPALTHGRVKNGFNGYATRVKLPNGGVSNTQPIGYNGGQQPKRNFKAQYNAQINAPNALTNSIGSSFTTKRANARRAGDPNRKLLGLPDVSWSAPGQASKKRKVSLSTGTRPRPCEGGPATYPNSFSFVAGSFPPSPEYKGIYRDFAGLNPLSNGMGNILPPNCPPQFEVSIYQKTDCGVGCTCSGTVYNCQNQFDMYGFPPNTTKKITITRNNVVLPTWNARSCSVDSNGRVFVLEAFNAAMPIYADGDIIKVEFLD